MNKDYSYWESLSPRADKAIDELMEKFKDGNVTPVKVFQELKQISKDYDDIDLCKETLNKMFDFMVENSFIEMDDLVKAYQDVFWADE